MRGHSTGPQVSGTVGKSGLRHAPRRPPDRRSILAESAARFHRTGVVVRRPLTPRDWIDRWRALKAVFSRRTVAVTFSPERERRRVRLSQMPVDTAVVPLTTGRQALPGPLSASSTTQQAVRSSCRFASSAALDVPGMEAARSSTGCWLLRRWTPLAKTAGAAFVLARTHVAGGRAAGA